MIDAKHIRGCPLFSELDDLAVDQLQRVAQGQSFESGAIIFGEGDDASSLYILVNGAVDLIKMSPDGKEQLVRRVKGGEVFAEAVMFSGETYPVTAITSKRSELLVITKDRFVKLVKNHPEIAMTMIGTMSKLLRHLNRRLSELSLGSVSQRLAAYILQRIRDQGASSFRIGIPKKDLAAQLGTIAETLSRNLRKMREDGLIELRRDTIIVKNNKGLRDIAG